MDSFGAYLKSSRVLRGLALEEIAAATRLPARIVVALESDDLRALQDRSYALLVARSCATAIGLDPEETALRLEEYMQVQPLHTLPPPPRPEPRGRIPRGLFRLRRRLSSALRSLPRLREQPVAWTVVLLTLCACALVLLRR